MENSVKTVLLLRVYAYLDCSEQEFKKEVKMYN